MVRVGVGVGVGVREGSSDSGCGYEIVSGLVRLASVRGRVVGPRTSEFIFEFVDAGSEVGSTVCSVGVSGRGAIWKSDGCVARRGKIVECPRGWWEYGGRL